RLAEEIELGERHYRALRRRLLDAIDDAPEEGGQVIVIGQFNLLGLPDWGGMGHLREVMAALENKKRLIRLLDGCLEAAQGVRVFIGAEATLGLVSGCALVASRFSTPDGRLSGGVGVLGPARLNYARVIPLVDFASRSLSAALAEA
ncbi:MAG: heat-inducible transcriptional repressor HrcA, partial [Magnetococcales bacterium]|nr:heat-inducible transcriptional repressor HrcA [Magnetococcales bacterium]